MFDRIPRNMLHTNDPEQKDVILEWCRQNNMYVEYLGVFIQTESFKSQVRWLVPDDKEKTMFKLKWQAT